VLNDFNVKGTYFLMWEESRKEEVERFVYLQLAQKRGGTHGPGVVVI
jgi:hypothetical protein